MTTTDPKPLDLDAIDAKWLQQCGPHDYGVDSAGCACPDGDYRPVMLDLVREVERLRAEAPTIREWSWRHNRYVSRDSYDQGQAMLYVDLCRRANPDDDISLVTRTVTEWVDVP